MNKQVRIPRREVHGWLILDKPLGMTSTHAVARAKRFFKAKKAGHAGTLDPLATGCLPIAFGEATKTVPFAMDGHKTYRFTVQWGSETDTDDAEGRVTATSAERPDEAAIRAVLPRFTGTISQVPPRFSAIKVDGERAYDLARDGEDVELAAREIDIHSLTLVHAGDHEAEFAAECGKGAYVRALARDIGRALGCLGHITALRRTSVGPFREDQFITIESLEAAGDSENPQEALDALLHPVETALANVPLITVSRTDAARLTCGQPVLLRGRDAPVEADAVYVTAHGALVALGEVVRGELHPRRIFNLPR